MGVFSTSSEFKGTLRPKILRTATSFEGARLCKAKVMQEKYGEFLKLEIGLSSSEELAGDDGRKVNWADYKGNCMT